MAKAVRASAPTIRDQSPPPRPESGEAPAKPTVRNQIDHLRDAFGSDTPDFSQKLSSLTRKEAALADEQRARRRSVRHPPAADAREGVADAAGKVRAGEGAVHAADVPPAKDDSAPPGMSLSLQGLAVSFSWNHPTYFVSEDRQAGRTEQALRDPGRLPGNAAVNMPVHAPAAQPASDEVVEDRDRAPAAPATRAETVKLATSAADPAELTDSDVDLGYLALYEDLIPAVNKSAARPTDAHGT